MTITFPAIATFTWSGGSATLAATANSGLAVTYTVLSGTCSVSGATLKATAAGICVVAADQAGNAGFSAAAQVTTPVTVTADDQAGGGGGNSGCSSTGPAGSVQFLITLGVVALWRRRRAAIPG